MLDLGPRRTARRPSLTPMIDVVFLLLVFFMLASRFGTDFAMPLRIAGGEATSYRGPPRVIDVLPEGQRLNGIVMDLETALVDLSAMTTSPSDTIILRARDGAALQRLVDVMSALKHAGHTGLAVIE